jgi:hypothetical protein
MRRLGHGSAISYLHKTMQKHLLSKSTYMAGRQCLKRLYLNKYERKLKDPVTPALQARFDAGHEVGRLAQQLFPGGVDCSPEHYWNFGPSIEKTLENIHYGQRVIYEAAFQYKGVLAALDILVLEEDGWHGYEVKSTSETKLEHKHDAALQYWVMKHSGHKAVKMHIVHLNRDYVRDGGLDVAKLFAIDDITEDVLDLQKEVAERVKTQLALLESRLLPDIDIGPHCSTPYTCDFTGHCWQHIPDYSVFDLNYGGKKSWDLYRQGIVRINDIPDDADLTDNQRLQVEAEKTGKAHIDRAGLRAFLDRLAYPLCFLDFETFMPAVPVYNHSRPYQQIPFQYSLHIQASPQAEPQHFEFLAEAGDAEPRKALLDRLIPELEGADLRAGSILVYNQKFEEKRLMEMSNDFPEYHEAIGGILERLRDLMDPFMHKLYYLPAMHGSYSMKKVLPALVPGLSYEGLDISEGGEAMLVFESMVKGDFTGDVQQAREALLAYCRVDTLGMVRLVDALHAAAG